MRRGKNIFFAYRLLFWAMVLFAIAGIVFQWLYADSSKNAISTEKIENSISKKEKSAQIIVNQIKGLLERNATDSLRVLALRPLPEKYFVYKGGELIFWTDNLLKQTLVDSPDWKYYATPNAHILAKSEKVNEYRIVSCIFLKHNFPYENNDLNNEFAKVFNLNKDIKIVENAPNGKYAIRDSADNYLFTLETPAHKIYNTDYSDIAFVLFSIAFFLFFYLYAHAPLLLRKRYFSRKEFGIIVGPMALIVFFLLKTSLPSTFFQNDIFTSYHYATNTFLSTLTHLTFFTAFLFSTIYLYAYYLKKNKATSFLSLTSVFTLILSPVYYVLLFYVLNELVFNSSTYLNVLQVNDISLTTVWNHFLLLVWGVGYFLLFNKTHKQSKSNFLRFVLIDTLLFLLLAIAYIVLFDKYIKEAILYYLLLTIVLYLPIIFPRLKSYNWHFALYIFAFALFVVNNSIVMNADKKQDQYRLLAENLYFNESLQEERMTESMLFDLETELKTDAYFHKAAVYPDSVIQVNDYLNGKYLRGFWNRYEMKLFATYPKTNDDRIYQELTGNGIKIPNTHFYKINDLSTTVSYLGFFRLRKNNRDSVNVYMEFYPNSNYKSYSYPDLLVESSSMSPSQTLLSLARYAYGDLIYSSGKFKYPKNGKWIQKYEKDFFVQDFDGYRHYVYNPGKYNFMIVSEGNIPGVPTYFIYFLYTFIVFFAFSFLTFWSYKLLHREKIAFNLTSKLLISFISLMVLCFGAIFYLALSYTQEKYKEKQRTEIGLKKNYIQSALQEKYYWTQKLDSTMTNVLNFDLQDLSYTYHTDINVYDNRGMLVGSSQPAIFAKNLVSKSISPRPYFADDPNISQYEHIGKLEYLATYADFYNGDFLQIGYISIPQFLSNDEYKSEAQSFFVVLVHISLIVIVLFILISILIGRRLTAPLTIVENRLKAIRLGKENKKIDYKSNDEVGQLVSQYNRTVEELERSAQMLASSERDTAWKMMARQVAHEINNPLTPMKLTIQQLQRTKKMNSEQFDAYFEKSTATLIEQIENLTRIAGSFSSFARLPEPNFDKVDVAKNIAMVVQLFSNNNENIEVNYTGAEEGVYAFTDREQLIQVFNNLLKNAVQAIPDDRVGKIRVRLRKTERDIFVSFEDNGKGISDEIKEKLFVPNFTTKSTGMGLGLAISQNIIRASKGEISFESKENSGAIFIVRLPRMN